MKKILLLFSLFCGSTNIKAQEIPNNNELFWDMRENFISSWFYFRMQKNPLLTYEETHTEYRDWKLPSQVVIPDIFFTRQYDIAMKIYRWEQVYKRPKDPYYEQVRSSFWFVIEKGDGLTRIDKEFVKNPEYKEGDSTSVPRYIYIYKDTLVLNVYDSLFPYDNRFLIAYDEEDKRQKFRFYSGNVNWEPLRENYPVANAGFMRGVQFGVEWVQSMDKKLIDSLRKLRPEYPDYVYATADESFLSKGTLLIAGHEKSISDYIEYIFYTDDPEKTGGRENEYYEMRYVLPTNIKSITERRMIKRKLPEEEVDRIWSSYLRFFVEDFRKFSRYIFSKTDEEVIDME